MNSKPFQKQTYYMYRYGGKVTVESFCVGRFRKGTTTKFDLFLLQILKRLFQFLFKNCFEVCIYNKGNFKLVLSTMKPHKKILLRHVYPNCFDVYAIFEMFVSGLLTVKSLEVAQEEVLFVSIATIATPKSKQ